MTLKNCWCRTFVILLIISGVSIETQAQKTVFKNLSWKYIKEVKVTPSEKKNILWFDGALADEASRLPLYIERFEMPVQANTAEATLINADYQDIGSVIPEGFATQLALLNKPLIETMVVIEQKRPFAVVTVNPFRKNPITGRTEKLVSFGLSFSYSNSPIKAGKAWTFASNSVLSTGDWFKVGVTQTGIYRLTYTDLQTLGVAVDDIDPRNISIYGQGGKPLPENNGTFRHDDLQENAITVVGEGDGSFDAGDYIIFYGVGVVDWNILTSNKRYYHALNKYATKGYYFLNVGPNPGKRVQNQASLVDIPDYTCDRYQAYLYHEVDSLNLIKSGKEFFGEVFDINLNYEFMVQLPNAVPGTNVWMYSSVLARSFTNSLFDIYINGTKRQTQHIDPVDESYTAQYANFSDSGANDTLLFSASSPVTIRYTYNKYGSSSAMGWLNCFTLNYTSYLNYYGGQMAFRDQFSIGKGVTEFSMTNASAASVWNVTDPLDVTAMNGTLVGNTFLYRVRTDSLLEFVAHNGTSYFAPSLEGRVGNQNLHAMGQYDMVVLSNPLFESYAAMIVKFHQEQDGLDVVLVRPEQVYNEFSSGVQDPTAIRAFMKMFYDRAGADPDLMPRYLLLFGDGSYDNMNRLPDNTNFIVTWQTSNSLAPSGSWLTDDYFGFLDDSEYGAFGGNMDIAIGRIPVKTSEEAAAVVGKILRYGSTTDLASQSGSCSGYNSDISNFADWRNVLCFVADDTDQPGDNFLLESENITRRLDTVYPVYNIDKIYLDAYTQVSTPGGQRYPDVNDLINKRVAKGALIINYIGHGGETGWAHEAVLGVSDINGWENINNMPMFVTATCEFSRFDDPARTSAGEYVLLNPNGGGIALFTTTRLAYTGSNAELDSRFYNYILDESDNTKGMGDAVKSAKNSYGCQAVIANFCMLGDPALKLAIPEYTIITTRINSHNVGTVNDTLRALSKVTVSGEIQDGAGNKLTSYNGILFPAIFDKRTSVTSLGNDLGIPRIFSLQKNVIYKGKASITNGEFTFAFLVPKDIAYHYGEGKMSYYAKDGTTIDGHGYFTDFIIGGTENNAITDVEGPEIDLYLNDENFVSGGITDADPFLFARVADSGGINTVGSGIGHDIAAVLDNNTDNTFVLNDYYEADMNTYQSGLVRYPFNTLEEGSHTLNLKVWDVFNNSSEKTIDFVVADNANLALDHVLNYPNPFTTYTEFWFEHNQSCCGLDVQIQIFTITGKLIKTIDALVQTTGYRADPIPWDGLDEYGDPIGKGVYVYKLRVKNAQGDYAEKLEKLVILR